MSFEDIAVLCIIGVKRSSSLTAKAAWVTTLAEREEDEHLRWAREDIPRLAAALRMPQRIITRPGCSVDG